MQTVSTVLPVDAMTM